MFYQLLPALDRHKDFGRCTLILLLAEALFVVWILEQPSGSSDVIWLHPRLNWFSNEVGYATCLELNCSGPWFVTTGHPNCLLVEVYRVDFWMAHHGCECAKRTSCWSNDGHVVKQLVATLPKTTNNPTQGQFFWMDTLTKL